MMRSKKFIVITSINDEKVAFSKFADLEDWTVILVGDRKGPTKIEDDRIIFLGIEEQKKLGFSFVDKCPENHYARKNIGYLYAMKLGAEIIAETDDDNLPKENWGRNIEFNDKEIEVINGRKFYNIYKEFTESFVWPRGFPLKSILDEKSGDKTTMRKNIGVWQFLADNDPDVDAIYRLTIGKEVKFMERNEFVLDKNVYCPFNSQNTFWRKETFPFMYLPQSVTFRFTDILRGYIAQRLIWEDDYYLGFSNATVFQERNKHDLMKDFSDEIPMYENIEQIIGMFDTLSFSDTPIGERILILYRELEKIGVVSSSELHSLSSWNDDLKGVGILE